MHTHDLLAPVQDVKSPTRAQHISRPHPNLTSQSFALGALGGVMVESCLHACACPRLARQGQLLVLRLMQRMNALGPRWRPTHFIPLVHIAMRLRTALYRIGSLATRLHALATLTLGRLGTLGGVFTPHTHLV